jgi:hypothetical protein
MKIRIGFVSNSSTTSFMIFGICFEDTYELGKMLGLWKTEDEYDDKDEDAIYDTLDQNVNKLDLDHYRNDDNCWYIGTSLSNIKNNETGLQFKQRVAKNLSQLLKKEFGVDDLEILEESWRD